MTRDDIIHMPRAVVEQLLEALEYHVEQTRPIHRTSEAITALRAALAQPIDIEAEADRRGRVLAAEMRAALAQPDPEPVAWLVMDESGYVQHAASWRDAAHEHINDAINEHALVCARTWRVVPVYTAPPKRSR